MATVILKNTDSEVRNWGGISISSNQQYTVQEVDRIRLLSDPNLVTDLQNGIAVVNDGSSDMSYIDAIRYLYGAAADLFFSNSINGFSSKTVQQAIEEAKSIALSKSRFCITTCFNGTVRNNQWLGFSELLPGNRVPIRIGTNCTLKEIAVSYDQSNLIGIPLSSENIDGQLKIFKNGLTDPTHVVHTETFTNQPGGKIITGLNIALQAGDFIVARWADQGDNPSDMGIVYYFQPS